MDKYKELLEKNREYCNIASLLLTEPACRKSNWQCVRRYYNVFHNCTIDEALDRKNIMQPSSIERMIRKLKQVNHNLRDDAKDQAPYKEIGCDIPVVVRCI